MSRRPKGRKAEHREANHQAHLNRGPAKDRMLRCPACGDYVDHHGGVTASGLCRDCHELLPQEAQP